MEEVTKGAVGTVTNSMVEVADIKHLEEEVVEVEERLPEETWMKFFVSRYVICERKSFIPERRLMIGF